MGRLTGKLVQSATKYSSGRNADGDYLFGVAETGIPCLFRDISMLQRGIVNRDEVQIDGLLWFDADRTVLKGEIYGVGAEMYQIQKVIIARDRLRTNAIQFIKCEVTRTRQVS